MSELLFLGTGFSLGVPVVGCKCKVCTSTNPYNKRMRPSLLVELDGKRILIDAPPDFRSVALKYDIHTLDGVLLTHLHYDHMGGFDDLRVFGFFQKKALPVLLSKSTHEEIQKRFDYLFKCEEAKHFALHILPNEFGEISFLGFRIKYFTYYQGKTAVTGYRIGNFAYVTDIFRYNEQVIERLKGVQILIISALKPKRTAVHFGIEDAIEFSNKINPDKVFLTHISHDIDYDEQRKDLPSNVFLSYDGLKVQLE